MGRFRNTVNALFGWDDTPVAVLDAQPIEEKARYSAMTIDQFARALEDSQPTGSASSMAAMVRAFIGWTYVCCSINAQTSASVPLKMYVVRRSRGSKGLNCLTREVPREVRMELYERKHLARWTRKAEAEDIEEITEHPFLDVLDAANPVENGFDLLYRIFMFLGLTGNAYWYLLMNGLGVPTEIWTRMPQYTVPITDKGFLRRVLKYRYRDERMIEDVMMKPEEVVHFTQPNPQSMIVGWGNLAASSMPADISKVALEYEQVLFENQARPDYLLNIKGSMKDAARKRLMTDLKNSHKGHTKAGKTMIAESEGGMDVKALNFPPKEMAFLQGHKITREMIAAAHHVPLSMLTSENVNRANADTGRQTHAENAVRPMLTLIEGKINERLMPMYAGNGTLDIFVAFDDPVGEDWERKLKERELDLKSGRTTINEDRAADGLLPVEWGDVPIMPMTMAPLGSQPLAPPGPPGEPPQDDEPPKGAEDGGYIAIGAEAIAGLNGLVEKVSRRDRIVEDLRERERGALKLRPWLRAYFAAQERASLMAFGKSAKDADDLIRTWEIGLSKWNKRFADGFTPLFKSLVAVNGRRRMAELPVVGVAFDVESPALTEHLQRYVPKLAGEINAGVIEQLRRGMLEGMAEGETTVQLRKRIQTIFGDEKGWKSMRTARTESARAQMAATEEAFVQSGVVLRKIWLTAGDPCDWCADLEGTTVALGTAYYDQGETQILAGAAADGGNLTRTYDYEPVMYPPLHPNCRCTIVEEIG